MNTRKPDLVLTRVFDASRERVWKAWTDPRQFAKWWGPHHFTALAFPDGVGGWKLAVVVA